MTKKELLKLLSEATHIDGDAEVILEDEELNQFKLLGTLVLNRVWGQTRDIALMDVEKINE